jgi:hypothetical protein
MARPLKAKARENGALHVDNELIGLQEGYGTGERTRSRGGVCTLKGRELEYRAGERSLQGKRARERERESVSPKKVGRWGVARQNMSN